MDILFGSELLRVEEAAEEEVAAGALEVWTDEMLLRKRMLIDVVWLLVWLGCMRMLMI